MELIPFTTKDLASFLEMSHDMYDSPAVAHPVSRDIFISTFRACLAGNQNVEGRMIVENSCTLGYLLLAHSFSSELGTPIIMIEEPVPHPGGERSAHRPGYSGISFLPLS